MADMRVWKDIEGEQVARELLKREKQLLYGLDLIDIRYLCAENMPAAGGCKQFVRVRKLGSIESALAREVPKERGDEDDEMPIEPVFVVTRPYPTLLPTTDGLEPIMFHALSHISVVRNVVVGHGRDGGFDAEVQRYGKWRAGLELPYDDHE